MFQPVYSSPPSSPYFATRRHRCFMNRDWKRYDEEVLGPYVRPEVVQSMMDMDTAYGSWQAPDAQLPSFGVGVPAAGFRQNRYLGPIWGTDGNSARKHDWYNSHSVGVLDSWLPDGVILAVSQELSHLA